MGNVNSGTMDDAQLHGTYKKRANRFWARSNGKNTFLRWKQRDGKLVNANANGDEQSTSVGVATATPQSNRSGVVTTGQGRSTIPDGPVNCKQLVNINTCNSFDLLALDGMDQHVATNIIVYRMNKGQYKQLNRILKVPGVTKSMYNRIAPFLTVASLEDDDSSGLRIVTGGNSNNAGKTGNEKGASGEKWQESSGGNGSVNLMRERTEDGKDLQQENIDLIYQLMCSKSERPNVKLPGDQADYETQQVLELQLGCWDLEECSFDKANNPGVLEVICMTILEQRWNIIAFMNFTSDHVLDRLVTELNFPTLPKVKIWRQNCIRTPRFDCISIYSIETGSYYGYVFATEFVTMVNDENAANITFKSDNNSVSFRYNTLDYAPGELSHPIDQQLMIEKCTSCIPSARPDCLHFGQYVVHWGGSLSSTFTGQVGMVDQGLSHLAIPNGWKLGGRVTESSPIWLRFSHTIGRPVSPQ